MALPTDRELALLKLLQTDPDRSLRQLADALGVTHPTVLTRLARLQELGLAEYDPPVHGFRPKRLTDRGVRFLRDVKKVEIAT